MLYVLSAKSLSSKKILLVYWLHCRYFWYCNAGSSFVKFSWIHFTKRKFSLKFMKIRGNASTKIGPAVSYLSAYVSICFLILSNFNSNFSPFSYHSNTSLYQTLLGDSHVFNSVKHNRQLIICRKRILEGLHRKYNRIIISHPRFSGKIKYFSPQPTIWFKHKLRRERFI